MGAGYANSKQVSGIINGTAINSEATSDTINIAGMNHVAFFLNFTWSAATAVTCEVDVSNDGGATWATVQEEDTSSPPTVTLANRVYTHAVTASDIWPINVPVFGSHARIRVTGTGADGSDTIVVDSYAGRL